MSKAVFLDRDGVINIDHGYVHSIDDFEYVDGVFEACRAIKNLGYKLVVVTNQSGIGRGMYSEDEFQLLTEWMDWNFEDKGVTLDGIYYCPHHPTDALGEYKIDCDCRKPKPGMIISAARFLKLDLSQCVMVGDKANDMRAGIAAGIKTNILVSSDPNLNPETASLATNIVKSIVDIPDILKCL